MGYETVELGGGARAAELRAEARDVAEAVGRVRLVVVVATDDESTAWYVRSITRAAEKVGIDCTTVRLPPDAAPAAIRQELLALSADPTVHGVILQTPLPPGASAADLAGAIAPEKDVDGANPLSLGRLAAGLPAFAPATAEAVVSLLDAHGIALAGRSVAVVGRSTVVGKPLAHLLLDRDATVTVCHSRTADLAAATRTADIVVAAAGRPGLIRGEHLAPGSVVVDVGTNATEDGGLTGDVDAESVAGRAAALSPVPGGVGPVTTALLLRHTALAAQRAAAGGQ
ncbi:bifunctional 5,10-methylenetetrahydrofolate dehydrogenase/5,10-methenyltetrahydrofolate cyclohydrolase [Actinacidiphila bryophytorum]|uniref:Bifunctional protein FolD n=1 Tax=Actinacidiphila bryophytorum TaxID=1436133 RepID=A0A9W4EBY5_9ACTN|nr:bifunctional 5,10-methylenetetrahydrofolate dehydrogenase/5,10-methenyltetrahydrofolate cyclohydrolase [Actinacidiphila bryophytorum]MBM9438986.1 bifunctional 5,10-methylenetetrahydrofolate dehydrogenase/5,10-methenyltetrahydrofolate cyclohydrolase [Actinacidiphila bryophytorum]MBN6546036.1 bifunctional 5,10-methylenetetrahydrofolate dehydrogenase/5,10-methenyltetrahydrofolate cyclohydrolase [Actinacidiphila bryophytorum]CAG7596933.1 Methylenetetrahydrofolate dehydrogenase / Methenyltetrahydr